MAMPRLSLSLKQLILVAFIVLLGHLVNIYIVSPRVPYSNFFKHDQEKLEKQILLHKTTAEKALKEYRSKIKGPVFHNPSAKRLCVGITSVYRNNVKYLEETIASMVTRVPLDYQDRVHLTLYNLDDPPTKHTTAKDLSSVVYVEKASYLVVDPEAGKLTGIRIKIKEFLDYLTVLKAEQARQCDHYLILEDDVLASQNWAKIVLDLCDEIDRNKEHYSQVKLFSIQKFGPGWWSWFRPTDYILIILLTAAFTSVLYALIIIAARLTNNLRESSAAPPEKEIEPTAEVELKKAETLNFWGHFSKINTIAIAFLALGTFSWVMVANRVTFVPESSGLSERDIGAMYQANLYTSDALDRWIDYLTEVYQVHKTTGKRLRPKDVYVRRFIEYQKKKNDLKFKAMIFTPNVFQHTGIESSIGNNRSLANALISYSFPDDDTPITFEETYIRYGNKPTKSP